MTSSYRHRALFGDLVRAIGMLVGLWLGALSVVQAEVVRPVAGMAVAATLAVSGLPQDSVKIDAKALEVPQENLRIRAPVTQAASSFQRKSVTNQQAIAINSASHRELSLVERTLQSGRFWIVVGVFFGAGLLLSLTPCVLPMLPILLAIIVGERQSVSRGHGLLMASSYSLGMAVVYTGLGIAAGLAGEGLSSALQTPWVLSSFAAMLALLSLSMFGVYNLQLPHAISSRIARTSQRLPVGQVSAVFAMGGVSALIVSPCVAAPLAGALVFISRTHDVSLGGTALFALSLGMSVPLLLLGASAGALLPRTGAWMNHVKQFFGLLLLVVAVWMLQPILGAPAKMIAWGSLLFLGAAMLRPFNRLDRRSSVGSWLRRFAGVAAGVIGLLQFAGAASGGADPLQPLAHLGMPRSEDAHEALPFQRVRSVAELTGVLGNAGRPVMLDFYADWCVACKEMERFTFSRPEVRARLTPALLLQVDVTENTKEDREMLRRFELFGPPAILFFDAKGREVTEARVIGFQDGKRFGQSLSAAGL